MHRWLAYSFGRWCPPKLSLLTRKSDIHRVRCFNSFAPIRVWAGKKKNGRISAPIGVKLLIKQKMGWQQTNPPPCLQAILMAIRVRRCEAHHIAQYSRSWATIDTTGHCHWASICPILPRRMPRSSILGLQNWVVVLRNRFPKLEIKRHQTGPLLRSLKQQAV